MNRKTLNPADPEITFVDQLLQHRAVRSQIAQTRFTWNRRSAWFPEAQAMEYAQISVVFNDCIQKYGAEMFEYYAKKNRLHKKYTKDNLTPAKKAKRRSDPSMDHLAGYKVPKTTNGIYGSVRPSHLFHCMDSQN
ncbi:uncharacterized protein LOC110184931 [Drosophila serrata]|uniref:uncharacterized protein LOC110184931 n=1 Tax=Drosophila serrata TaxID=7274 RepID=UPI000A1D1917|nr:uncharacterized protein LOC110184931 [Drosophila serrata]KAH8362583.1 hypothetical protein KR200_005206 [Drosophila serrata]